MAVFRILYTTFTKSHETTELLEWVAPSDWTSKQTRECFKARFPHASILHFSKADKQ